MGSTLTSKTMTEINLVTAKFSKIRAEVGVPNKATGGELHVGTETKIIKGDAPNQAIGTVTISIVALPKGVTDKNLFAFRIAVTVDGVFEWKEEASDLADNLVEHSLLQSLFLMATLEITSIAQKMGFPNIQLPLDIRVSSSLAKKSSRRKAVSAKLAAVKPKPKKT